MRISIVSAKPHQPQHYAGAGRTGRVVYRHNLSLENVSTRSFRKKGQEKEGPTFAWWVFFSGLKPIGVGTWGHSCNLIFLEKKNNNPLTSFSLTPGLTLPALPRAPVRLPLRAFKGKNHIFHNCSWKLSGSRWSNVNACELFLVRLAHLFLNLWPVQCLK